MNGPNLFSLLTLFLGLILGHWLRIGSDSAKNRRTFRDYLAALDDEFASEWRKARIMDSSDFENWNMLASHYASVPQLKAEAIKVREDIRWWKRRSFRKICESYAGFGSEVNFEANHAKFDRIRKESHALLERLSECAN